MIIGLDEADFDIENLVIKALLQLLQKSKTVAESLSLRELAI